MTDAHEQLWKTWDRAANKTGARNSVFWVKVNRPQAAVGERRGPGAAAASAPQYKTGARYTGSWVNNAKDGYGTQVWPNGNKYEGEWRQGRKHGKGTFWVKRGGKLSKLYTGDWHGDEKHVRAAARWPALADMLTRRVRAQGLGIYFYEDGSKYEGEWFRNVRHGRGKLVYANGDVYEGDWDADKRSGPGVLALGARGRRGGAVWEARACSPRARVWGTSQRRSLRGPLEGRQEGGAGPLFLLHDEQDVRGRVGERRRQVRGACRDGAARR